MEVQFISKKYMFLLSECKPYHGEDSCYGLFIHNNEYYPYQEKSREIFVLSTLSVWNKIITLFHEVGHWIFSYLPHGINDLFDDYWEIVWDWLPL